MKTERQSRLEVLAYKIWEEQGRPEGRQEDHWAEAERRLRSASDAPGQTTQMGSRDLGRKPTLSTSTSTRDRPR